MTNTTIIVNNVYNVFFGLYVTKVKVIIPNHGTISFGIKGNNNFKEVRKELYKHLNDDKIDIATATIKETYKINDHGIWTEVEKF
jgi:hypothetical protein